MLPLTSTRACSISSSQARREPMPARASTFCSRSPSCSPKVLGSLTAGLLCRARLRSSIWASYSRGRAGADALRARALGAPLLAASLGRPAADLAAAWRVLAADFAAALLAVLLRAVVFFAVAFFAAARLGGPVAALATLRGLLRGALSGLLRTSVLARRLPLAPPGRSVAPAVAALLRPRTPRAALLACPRPCSAVTAGAAAAASHQCSVCVLSGTSSPLSSTSNDGMPSWVSPSTASASGRKGASSGSSSRPRRPSRSRK